MIKYLLKFKWYRTKHLRDLMPDEYKEAYDMINSDVPLGLGTTMAVCSIVENIKNGNYENPINQKEINENVKNVREQFEQKDEENRNKQMEINKNIKNNKEQKEN